MLIADCWLLELVAARWNENDTAVSWQPGRIH
jgi:hypothetical protein